MRPCGMWVSPDSRHRYPDEQLHALRAGVGFVSPESPIENEEPHVPSSVEENVRQAFTNGGSARTDRARGRLERSSPRARCYTRPTMSSRDTASPERAGAGCR